MNVSDRQTSCKPRREDAAGAGTYDEIEAPADIKIVGVPLGGEPPGQCAQNGSRVEPAHTTPVYSKNGKCVILVRSHTFVPQGVERASGMVSIITIVSVICQPREKAPHEEDRE